MQPLVIIGAGLAGYTLAREWRKHDAHSPLTLVCADHGDFYAKPMLSNAFAQHKEPERLINAPAAQMAEQLGARLLSETRVEALDIAAQRITTAAGTLEYGALVLALGADPIRLPLAGDAAAAVLSVNDLDDYRRLRGLLKPAARVAILGGGLIGCEFANDFAGAGLAVTLLDPAPRPLASLAPAAVGERLAAALVAHGVDWRPGRALRAVEHAATGYRLTLDDGSELFADVVLSAVGLRPRTQLAQAAGLATARGVVVDGGLRSSAPAVYALGDCAEIDGRVRAYVMPIMQAARALAQTLAGTPSHVAFPPMPVVVKTPACPIVVEPPAAGLAVDWRYEELAGGLVARGVAADGTLAGFALAGSGVVGQRNALVKALGAPV